MSQETGSTAIDRFRDRNQGLLRSLSRGWSRFTNHKLGVVGLLIMISLVLMAVFAPVLSPHSLEWTAPDKAQGAEDCETLDCLSQEDAGQISHPAPPKFGELTGDLYFAPLGTDDRGADILTQLIWGSRTALYIGFAAGILSSLVGVPLGLISGFYGDTWIDETIQRIVDIMYGLPFLPLVIVLVALRGITTTNVIIAIAVKSWLNNAIVIRGETLSLKERSYIEAAEVAGASDTRIVFRHILPNVLPLGFVYLAQDAAFAVLTQAALAFLGLADFTNVSWGTMLQWIQVTGNVYSAPWWLIPPGLMITALAASFYFVGYSLEDVMNPHTD
ncbi:MAG: ABC transporter permease [Halobacteriales archaeon]